MRHRNRHTPSRSTPDGNTLHRLQNTRRNPRAAITRAAVASSRGATVQKAPTYVNLYHFSLGWLMHVHRQIALLH